MDMRTRIPFPNPPRTKEEIFNPATKPWLLACALVGKYDSWQHNTYRKYWLILGDGHFREILDVVRVILAESNGIRNPAGFLTAQFAAALLVSSVSKGEIYE